MIIAIIPARGGSKRLPRKNILPFAGFPLIAYSIAAANASKYVGRSIVTTDDAEIGQIAKLFGAEVVERPEYLATDLVKSGPVVQHAIAHCEQASEDIEAVVLLQPTNPLRSPQMVDYAIEMLLRNDVDSVITVTQSHFKIGHIVDGRFQPDYVPETRSQDLLPAYFENGQVYVTRGKFASRGELFGNRILPYITDPMFAVDIDTRLDFQVAEFLYINQRESFISVEENDHGRI